MFATQRTTEPPSAEAEPRILPMVVTFSTTTGPLWSKIKGNLRSKQEEWEQGRQLKVITAYRRNKNLKDILVHTALDRDKRRREAWEMKFRPYILNRVSGRGSPLTEPIGAQCFNLIYGIECQKCGLWYIGSTGRTLTTRVKEHLHRIKYNHKTTFLYRHFIQCGLNNFKALALEANSHWSPAQRRFKEEKWIKTLLTVHPEGLNEKHGN